jgi:hypothetical protein
VFPQPTDNRERVFIAGMKRIFRLLRNPRMRFIPAKVKDSSQKGGGSFFTKT